jgi:hypothetical protein
MLPHNKKINPLELLVSHFVSTLPDSLLQREQLLKVFIERIHLRGDDEKEQAVKLEQILFHIRQHTDLIQKLQSEFSFPEKLS